MSWSDLFVRKYTPPRDPFVQKVLEYAKTAREFTIADVQKATGEGYYRVRNAVTLLVKEEALAYGGGVTYRCLLGVDEAAPAPPSRVRIDHERLLGSFSPNGLKENLDLGDEDDGDDDDDEDDDNDDNDDNDDDDPFEALHRYIASQRPEVIEKLRFSDNEDDGDDDSDEEDGDHDEEDGDHDEEDGDDGLSPELREADAEELMVSAANKFEDIAGVIQKKGESGYFIIPYDTDLERFSITFHLYREKDRVYLSDEGNAIAMLITEVPALTDGLNERIESITAWYGVERVGEELRIRVNADIDALAVLMKLFATMDRIVAIELGEHLTLVNAQRREAAAQDLLARLVQTDPEIRRAHLLELLRARYDYLQGWETTDVLPELHAVLSAIEAVCRLTNEEDYEDRRTEWCIRELADTEDGALPVEPLTRSVDPDFIKALSAAVKEGKVSIAFLHSKCKLDYAVAATAIGWMEDMGYVSPFDGRHRRTVLLTQEQFDALYGSRD